MKIHTKSILFQVGIMVLFSCSDALNDKRKESEKTKDDGKLIFVDRQDKEMEEAFIEAKKTLNTFIYRATEKKSTSEIYGAYIKVVEDDIVEYLWVTDFKKYDEKHFIGVLITKPELIKQFKDGQTVGFLKEDIFDWQIYNKTTGKLDGSYTFKVLDKNK